MKTADFISDKLQELDFDTVLEVGCGDGRTTKEVLENHSISRYVACDQDDELCKQTRTMLYGNHRNLEMYLTPYSKFVIADKKFDLVMAIHVLEGAKFFKFDAIEMLDKMCRESKKYVVHTIEHTDDVMEFWGNKKNEWTATGYTIDKIRKVIIAERI